MNLFPQRLAVYKLHRDEVRTVAFSNLVDVGNVRMIKCRGRFRLLNETPHAVLVCREVSRQNLQRNFAIKFCILRQVHFTHSARTNLRDDAVVGQRAIWIENLTHLFTD